MRTTIELPTDLHERVRRIARGTSRTLSDTVVDLVRRGLAAAGATAAVTRSERTGLLVVLIGRTITTDDVRALDDSRP